MPHYGFDVRWSPADGEYVALCPSFPGLSAFGDTPAEALAEAHDALALYIEEYEADGVPLPPAIEAQSHSGQTRLRMPKSLHATAARLADADGVSLNTLLVSYVAAGVGADQTQRVVTDAVCAEVSRLGRRIETKLTALTDAFGGELGAIHGQIRQIAQYQSPYVAHFDDGPQDPVLRRVTGLAPRL